jgi:hypothetical protein
MSQHYECDLTGTTKVVKEYEVEMPEPCGAYQQMRYLVGCERHNRAAPLSSINHMAWLTNGNGGGLRQQSIYFTWCLWGYKLAIIV